MDLSKEEFFKGISKPVNAKLQKIFGQLGFVEQTGHGVPLIVNQYGKQAFDVMDNYLNVIIPFNKLIDKQKKYGNMGDAEQKVLDCLRQYPDLKTADLVVRLGYSNAYIRKILDILKQKKFIRRIGSNKTGHWEVIC